MRGTRVRVVLGGLVVVLASLVTTTTASGQVPPRIGVEVVGGGPVFDFGLIYPGATDSSVVRVTNLAGDAGRLAVDAIDIVDESRCSQAEDNAGIPCGSGVGYLGAQMTFTIERLLTGGGSATVWTGRIDELQDIDLSDVPLPAGDTWEYRFSGRLPRSSGNETQNDILGFDLRFDLREDVGGTDLGQLGIQEGSGIVSSGGPSALGEVDGGTVVREDDGTVVAGSVIDRAVPARFLGIALPRTGADVIRALFVGGAALLIGSTLLLVQATRSRRATATPS